MRKFIYLFMFLFACTSYAQTEQISGQFRLIGTQEQPEADKVLTIDDNGDVGYMNSNKPSFARYQTQGTLLATSGFIEFEGTPDFTSGFITQEANKYEFKVNESGFYEVTLSWRSAFNNTYFLEFEINGVSKIINGFEAGGTVFQYTYREYLDEEDMFRISSDGEITNVKCTLYIKKIK